jgi:hypothetical protein
LTAGLKGYSIVDRSDKMKRLIAVIALIIVLLLPAALSCGGGETATTTVVKLDIQFSLGAGKTVEIEGENLTIQFVKVISDSRCPRGVECITEGEAQCRMLMTIMGSPAEMILTQKGYSSCTDYFLQYRIDFRLQPGVRESETISDGSYYLNMTVIKTE